jgi:hypothetical protein
MAEAIMHGLHMCKIALQIAWQRGPGVTGIENLSISYNLQD